MAKPDNKMTCGKIIVTFPADCSYVCVCTPQAGCHWYVSCGDWTTGGKGVMAARDERPSEPHVTVVGNLEVCAKLLEREWKRPLKLPSMARRQPMKKRTLKGTPEQIAQARREGRKICNTSRFGQAPEHRWLIRC